MNNELVNKLNIIYNQAKCGLSVSNEVAKVQKGLVRIVHLSNDSIYQQFLKNSLDDLCLEPVQEIEQTLRSIIVEEIGTEDETLVAPDAEDLSFLDKHDSHIAFANTNDVAELPVLSDLKQVVDTVIENAKSANCQLS